MAQFLDFNPARYSLNKQLFSTLPQSMSCVCCLGHESPLINISSCTHLSLLEYFFKFKMQLSNSMVCLYCHSLLKKFDIFKQQVEESIRILNSQAIEIKTVITNLQRSDIKVISYVEPRLDDNEEGHFDDNVELTFKEEYTCLAEVKIENDFPDFDANIPFAEVQAHAGQDASQKVGEKVKEKPKEKDVASTDKYGGKILTLTINREALLHERDMQKLDQKYLRLPYKCEDCVVSFEFEMAWKSHMEKQHNKDKSSFVCEICKSILSSNLSYKEHIRRHYRRYECSVCHKRYHDEPSAVQHYNDLHGQCGLISIQLYCDDCDFVTQSHRSYRYHRSKHKQPKQVCPVCNKLFVSASNLKIHMYTVHKQSDRAFECVPCGKVYKGKSGLFAHMNAAHGTHDQRAYCATCHTYYRTAQSLSSHLRTHSNHVSAKDNRFVCNECDTRFVTKASLKVHIEWEHLGIRKHRCIQCSKVFRKETSLKKHIQFVHEKKRPPRDKICDYCGQGFTTQGILKSHIRTHTGERPYCCKLCSATFAHASALYNHKKLLHNPHRVK